MNTLPPHNVLEAYGFENAHLTQITIGLIHMTYKIESQSEEFILQKQHSIFNEKTIEKIQNIAEYRKEKGATVQEVITTKDNQFFVMDGDVMWRCLTYVPGKVFEKIEDAHIAHEAGRILGVFHKDMQGYDFVYENDRPIHNTKGILKEFKDVLNTYDSKDEEEAQDLIKIVTENIEELLLPDGLRQVAVQGDPKISNIIFDEATDNALTLIDLDHAQRHTPLVELGDAFRSWCGKLEDDPENSFNLEYFKKAFEGYMLGSEGILTTEEKALIPQAIQLISLELAARFLKDYMEDRYFGWDETRYTSRKEHNLARAKGQIALFEDVRKKEQELTTFIESI